MRNYIKLKQIIDADATNTTLTDLEIAQKLNVQTTSATKPTLLTDITIMNLLGDSAGAVVLDSMDAAALASPSSSLKRALKRVYSQGVDVGNTKVVAKLNLLVTATVLTQVQADILINSATVQELEILGAGFGVVDPLAVSRARMA